VHKSAGEFANLARDWDREMAAERSKTAALSVLCCVQSVLLYCAVCRAYCRIVLCAERTAVLCCVQSVLQYCAVCRAYCLTADNWLVKAVGDRMQRTYCLSRVDRDWNFWTSSLRTDIRL
jgi:hypothetical protein